MDFFTQGRFLKVSNFFLTQTLLRHFLKKIFIFFQYSREIDDSKTCWHGGGIYEDCNNTMALGRNLKIRFYGKRCKWWHFFPKEKYANLKSKFDEIMQGKTENPIVNSLLKSAKSFKEKLPESSILKNLI